MKAFLLALGALWALHCNSTAGDLKETAPLGWSIFQANGRMVSAEWGNPTGQTIYIKRVEFYHSNIPGFVPVGAIARCSDKSNLIYFPADDFEDFGDDYFTIGPQDGLMLNVTLFGTGQTVGIAYWIWYKLAP